MEVPKIIQELLDKKAEMSNIVDLDAYANGLLDMYQALQLQQTGVSGCCDMSVCMKLPKCSKQCKDCNSVQ